MVREDLKNSKRMSRFRTNKEMACCVEAGQ